MSNETANKANPDEIDSEQTAEQAAEAAADESGIDDPVTVLEREVADLKDQLLRALAEAENTRRRAERDVADARRYSVAGFARDMLSVGDNFRRALEAMPEGDALKDPSVKSLVDGIQLTEAQKRRRRSRSIAIAVGLGVLVFLFYLITIFRMGAGVAVRPL